MPNLPTLTTIKPTAENITPYKTYTQTTPTPPPFTTIVDSTSQHLIHTPPVSTYSSTIDIMDRPDLPVLYAGGRKWILRTSDPTSLFSLPLNHSLEIDVDLFVMDSGLVIWFNELDKGLCLGYDCIVGHSIRRVSCDRRKELFMEVRRVGILALSDPVLNVGVSQNGEEMSADYQTVEFSLLPKFAEGDRYYQDCVESLFRFQEFGSNRGDTMVVNVFNGISKCSLIWRSEEASNVNSNANTNEMDQDMIDGEDIGNIGVHFTKEGYLLDTSGVADDEAMGYIQGEMDGASAGLEVEVMDLDRFSQMQGFKRGIIRNGNFEDEGEDPVKRFRM